MAKEDYKNILKTMYGLRRFGIKLGLSTISSILKNLGDPQDNFACIHVAGTNGKGSIASALSTILHASGYKTGLYTSPHLVHFNERICVNNRPVPDKNVVASYKAVTAAHHGEQKPTFFECTTAMALYEFNKQKVDWAVIETGMGGRLDATNIIEPSISIISNISIEHQKYLGNTLVKIAGADYGQETAIRIDGYSTYIPDFLGLALHYMPELETGRILVYACGDGNGDTNVNLLDVLYVIDYLYGNPQGPAPVPLESGDANADYAVNLLDILYLIDHLYGTPIGPAPICPL